MPMLTKRDLERRAEQLTEAVSRMARAEAQLAIAAGCDRSEDAIFIDIVEAFAATWNAVAEEDNREWFRNKYGHEDEGD